MSLEVTFGKLVNVGRSDAEENCRQRLTRGSSEVTRKKIVASASPTERLAGLAPEELERWLTQNEQVRKEVVAHAPPEERLAGWHQKNAWLGWCQRSY